MVLVPEVDASQALAAWLRDRRTQLEENGITANLRTSEVASQRPNKAAVELKRGEDLGLLTMWANGMIDCDLLPTGARDPQSSTRECIAVRDVVATLDAYLSAFVRAV
jgi:hypothetical protein